MKPTALATETIDIASFLAISRKHLGLSTKVPDGASARMSLESIQTTCHCIKGQTEYPSLTA